MRHLLTAFLIAQPALGFAASADPNGAASVACPALLGSTAQTLETPQPGWSAAVEGGGETKHVLSGFRINLGPVETPDGAIYDREVEKKLPDGGATRTMTWDLKELKDAYAVCSYARTKLVLVRPVTTYATCTMVLRRKKNSDYQIESASCR